MATDLSFTPHPNPKWPQIKPADVRLSIPDGGAVLVLFTEKGPSLKETVPVAQMHLVHELVSRLADAITISSKGKMLHTYQTLRDAAEHRFIASAISKLPMLDLFWRDDLQEAWWRCLEALARMARKSRGMTGLAALGVGGGADEHSPNAVAAARPNPSENAGGWADQSDTASDHAK